MIYIAHRGNLSGPDPGHENRPEYLRKALEDGYDIETDVWYVDGKWYLGHDSPQYRTEYSFLETSGVWCHAKNLEALERMLRNESIHCFWHQEDDYTITSAGYIWTYPGKELPENSICCVPERCSGIPKGIKRCAGVCTDYVYQYEEILEE